MSIQSIQSSAVVPARELELPDDIFEEVPSYFSIKDLLCFSAVNKKCRAVANKFLEELETPRDIRCPIYTRAKFMEKFRNCVARMGPDQELRLKITQFRRKNNPCPTIECSYSFKASDRSCFSRIMPTVINAHLDEINKPTDGDPESQSSSVVNGVINGRNIVRHSISNQHISSFAPTDLYRQINEIAQEKLTQLEASFLQERPRACNLKIIAASAALATVTLTTLYFFMNTADQSTRDL